MTDFIFAIGTFFFMGIALWGRLVEQFKSHRPNRWRFSPSWFDGRKNRFRFLMWWYVFTPYKQATWATIWGGGLSMMCAMLSWWWLFPAALALAVWPLWNFNYHWLCCKNEYRAPYLGLLGDL